MKKLSTQLVALCSIMLLVFSSCEKDEEKTVATAGKAGALSASTTSLTLTKANASATAITFTGTKADYGFQAAATNTIQLAVKGTNFAGAKEINLDPNVFTKTYTVIDFNALMLSLGLPTGTNSQVEVRMKTVVNSNIAPVYSNVLTLTVNPYALISYMYVPGDYQGWNPSTADSLQSATSNGIYIGIINFPAKSGATYEFKINPAKNWNTAYGDAGNGKISTSAGNNLKVAGANTYRITANLNDLTWKAERYSFGLIGSATINGWNSDQDMTFNNGTQTWSITTPLVVGEIKFRLNDDWGVNYGGSGGTLASGGSNIAIATAGTYEVTMNLVTNTYTVTKK